jgi:hypothetical protein
VLQRYRHGVDYPATKDQLVAHVRSQCEQAFGKLAQEILKGASYPASRDDLVAYARDQDAALPVIEALLRIPDQDYDDSDAVIIEIIEV